jgi:hypothetical protein
MGLTVNYQIVRALGASSTHPIPPAILLPISGSSSLHMKVSRSALKPIPEKQMPEWERVASQAHKRATKKKRADFVEHR